MWIIICPWCGHAALLEDFGPSLCDECQCPMCGCEFEVDLSTPDEEEEGE